MRNFFKSREPCRQCGLPIAFKKKNGKWHPCNPDGSNHWDDCKAAQRSGQPIEIIKGATTGPQDFQTLPCEASCSVPPWEDCPQCPQWLAYNEQQIRAEAEKLTGVFPRF